MPLFTSEEKKLLAPYVTSTEADVFAVKNLPGITGAVYARYSRAKGTFRETLLKEFITEGVVDPVHADELIARILIAYGDDSVGELEGAHVSFERISMLATKEIEDRRIGGSPIEQSTRYVFYDQKDERGEWLYYKGAELLNAPFGALWRDTMNGIFETYARLAEPMKAYFKKRKPIEEAAYDINGDGKTEKLADLTAERDTKAFTVTYNADVRTKACDTLRHLLPLSTLTNVGMFGNGRFFQGLISYLLTTDLAEAQAIGTQTLSALSDVIPPYVKRAARSPYVVEVRHAMFTLAQELGVHTMPDAPATVPEVVLAESLPGMASDASHDIYTIAAMLYPYAHGSLCALAKKVAAFPRHTKDRIVTTYIGTRRTRRDRPGRALEHGYPYTFDLVTEWGVYKDLMRHRINTQQRQLFTPRLGFYLAPEITDAGFADDVRRCVEAAHALFEVMHKESPLLAQYAVLHGNYVRWMLGMNDREAMHLIELRTTPQGHPSYRAVCQKMHQCIARRSPWRADAMHYADHNDYYWSRAESEARQRVKERRLEEQKK